MPSPGKEILLLSGCKKSRALLLLKCSDSPLLQALQWTERLQSEVLCSWVCIVLMPCMFYHGIVPILLYDPTFLLCPVWNDHCSILFPNRLAVQVGKRCLGRSLVNHKEQLVSHKECLVVWFSERLLFLMKLLTSAARISASSPPTAQIIPEQEPSAQQRLVG